MDVVLEGPTSQPLDIATLKRQSIELAAGVKSEDDFKAASTKLREQSAKKPTATVAPDAVPAPPAPQPAVVQGSAK
jgi:hypothetical protein